MDKVIMEAIEKALKDWGIDWILQERGGCFLGLMNEIESAVSKVID